MKCRLNFFLESLYFYNTRHLVHSCVAMMKRDCSLHVLEHISALWNTFSFERVFEQGIRTVHVLIVETKMYQFCVAIPQYFHVA